MNSIPAPVLRRLRDLLPDGELFTDSNTCQKYAGDKWFAERVPDAVALPRSTDSVSRLLAFAHRHHLPVTARGAGHGYVGGCVPQKGGVVLSLERMNRIKEIHAGDFVAVVEPGVHTQKLQEAVEKKGLYYPPDPASRKDCSIGGNIASNAGGPRCLKYGVTRDYVLGLEVVRANGDILRLGSRTHKNKTGFDLARFFVGSEGMLGVITEATLKLLPLPPYRALLMVGFQTMRQAAHAIRRIFAAGFLPCALEVADQFTLEAARRRTGSRRLSGCGALIFVELDGRPRAVKADLSDLRQLLTSLPHLFVQHAMGDHACEQLWQLRREFSYALRDTGLTKLNEDIVVPRGRLEDLFRFTARLQKQSGFPVACFGHAGDGNIHVNIMVDFNQSNAQTRSQKVLDQLFQQILAWGGVITGEHGVGLAKKKWFPQAVNPEVLRLHYDIKSAMDPNGILNPGKFL